MSPMKLALINSYARHRRFFYLEYYQNFKLFANWLLPDVDLDATFGAQPTWYKMNYEVQELAKILKLSEQEVLGTLEEIYNDY